MAKFISWDNRLQRGSFRKRYAFFYGRNTISTFAPADFEGQKERLNQMYEKMASPKYLAQTSGTTSEPKLLPYDLKRTRHLQKTFLRSMITLTSGFKGPRTFYVFASLTKDNSLTSGMMEEKNPGRLELLQAPYRYLHTKEGQGLIERVGELSARIMVLVITQPRFLYATNPSTLTFFLKELENNWKDVRIHLKKIPPGLMRLKDNDGERRIMNFVMREKAPTLKELLPHLTAVITWDGGYVKPFLDQLKASLPGIAFLPMYSMSTETIETLPHKINDKIHFFPVSKGMYPEFHEPGSEKIISPFELETGKIYELIVSDEWGLRRYCTRDLFLVKGIVNGLPDLSFVRRKGMTSSLTGEKLTEEHVFELSGILKKKFPELGHSSVSMFPVSQNGEFGYELAIVGKTSVPAALATVADQELGKINTEYASKVKSGRLRVLSTRIMSEQDLASIMGKENQWESQFKVLPLYEKLITR